MLSILIPCYNFSVFHLIKDLHQQAELQKIHFEIICAEDGSTEKFSNSDVKKFKNVTYLNHEKNVGRSKIRNLLSKQAKFKWLLFIDCDSKINNKNFLSDYLQKTQYSNSLFYGETEYEKRIKNPKKKLHWLYGKKIESKRKKKQFSSHHFLIQKKIFNDILFNEKIKGYGHEDTIFSIEMKLKNYKLIYIKNTLLHIGLENNDEFIRKVENSLTNLIKLSKQYKLNHLKIIRIHKILSSCYFDYIIIILFQSLKKIILKNLLSKEPNLLFFQFYKLGYYCKNVKKI